MCGILLIAERTAQGNSLNAGGGAGVTAGCQSAAAAAAAAADDAAIAAAVPFFPGLSARGPDHLGTTCIHVADSANSCGGGTELLLAASLLQLRGAARVRPPLASPCGGVLCFNGELFGGLDVPRGANDGERLLEALEAVGPEGAGPANAHLLAVVGARAASYPCCKLRSKLLVVRLRPRRPGLEARPPDALCVRRRARRPQPPARPLVAGLLAPQQPHALVWPRLAG